MTPDARKITKQVITRVDADGSAHTEPVEVIELSGCAENVKQGNVILKLDPKDVPHA